MPSVEAIRLKTRKKYIEITAKIRRRLLIHSQFTIISNNCWGGLIYQSYGLPYTTPTIGLFFMADDYIKFVARLRYYINSNIVFIDPENSRYYEILRKDEQFGKYPIGKLDDIEIMFLHYSSREEAFNKWTRRCNRIIWDKLLIKFNDQNSCTDQCLFLFNSLNIKNKVCFTSKKHSDLESTIFIRAAKRQEYIYASQEPFGKSKYIDVTKLLNSL